MVPSTVGKLQRKETDNRSLNKKDATVFLKAQSSVKSRILSVSTGTDVDPALVKARRNGYFRIEVIAKDATFNDSDTESVLLPHHSAIKYSF